MTAETLTSSPESLIYGDWLQAKIAATRSATSWIITLASAGVAGLLAIAGALTWSVVGFGSEAVAICLIGPMTEELMKVAFAMWVVEKRPYLFKYAIQIAICGAAAGLTFAAVENFLYLNIYVPSAPNELFIWRWTTCTALHVGCSLIASCGIIAVWTDAIQTLHRPRSFLAAQFIVIAILIHAIYNTLATVMSLSVL